MQCVFRARTGKGEDGGGHRGPGRAGGRAGGRKGRKRGEQGREKALIVVVVED